MGKRFASFYFYHCLAFARFWKVKFWKSFIKCQYFNDGWTDFHKNISLSWAFFENRKSSGLTPGQNDDPVTRTWKITQMTRWPNDPVPCLVCSQNCSNSCQPPNRKYTVYRNAAEGGFVMLVTHLTCTENLAKFWGVVAEVRSRTDQQTDWS